MSLRIRCDRYIVIVNDMTSDSRKKLATFEIQPEIILLDDIQVNITDHHLVPKHEVLNEDQKHELLKKYRIKEH